MGPKNIAPEHENEMEWERSKKKVEEEMIMKILLGCVCLAYVVAGGRYENFVGWGKEKCVGGGSAGSGEGKILGIFNFSNIFLMLT